MYVFGKLCPFVILLELSQDQHHHRMTSMQKILKIYIRVPSGPPVGLASVKWIVDNSEFPVLRSHVDAINYICMTLDCGTGLISEPELSTGRMNPRVGSGRVTIFPDFGGSGRVSISDF